MWCFGNDNDIGGVGILVIVAQDCLSIAMRKSIMWQTHSLKEEVKENNVPYG